MRSGSLRRKNPSEAHAKLPQKPGRRMSSCFPDGSADKLFLFRRLRALRYPSTPPTPLPPNSSDGTDASLDPTGYSLLNFVTTRQLFISRKKASGNSLYCTFRIRGLKRVDRKFRSVDGACTLSTVFGRPQCLPTQMVARSKLSPSRDVSVGFPLAPLAPLVSVMLRWPRSMSVRDGVTVGPMMAVQPFCRWPSRPSTNRCAGIAAWPCFWPAP